MRVTLEDVLWSVLLEYKGLFAFVREKQWYRPEMFCVSVTTNRIRFYEGSSNIGRSDELSERDFEMMGELADEVVAVCEEFVEEKPDFPIDEIMFLDVQVVDQPLEFTRRYQAKLAVPTALTIKVEQTKNNRPFRPFGEY